MLHLFLLSSRHTAGKGRLGGEWFWDGRAGDSRCQFSDLLLPPPHDLGSFPGLSPSPHREGGNSRATSPPQWLSGPSLPRAVPAGEEPLGGPSPTLCRVASSRWHISQDADFWGE